MEVKTYKSNSKYMDITEVYKNSLAKERCLEANYEAELFKKNDDKARETIIKSHIRLVVGMACKYHKYSKNTPMQDLMQEGMIGLIKAFNKYKWNPDTRFASYAKFWVKSSIIKYSRKNCTYIAKLVDKADEEYDDNLEKFHEQFDYLDELNAKKLEYECVKNIIDNLSYDEKFVVQKRYLEEKKPYKYISDTLRLPLFKVRIMEEKILRKLKKAVFEVRTTKYKKTKSKIKTKFEEKGM